MAVNRKVSAITLPANADLSSNQFRIMAQNDGGSVVAAVDEATPYVGVLMNKPAAAGREAEIAINGSVVKLEAGAAVTGERDAITAVAGGRGSPTTTAVHYIIGRALTPASGSGVLFEVLVQPDRAGTTAF